ncbi:MAG: hypothetical protein OEV02_09260 [Gammaproteobacteria bacterium]|jgi:hypothetical protein|nr:hypothetical protein [Gammaproteobacteria bacterium]
MLRLIGILTGATLAIAFLIIALGVPEFAKPKAEVNPEAALEMTVQRGPMTEPEPEAAAEAAPESEAELEAAAMTEAVAEPAPEPDYEALVEQIFAPTPESAPEPVPVIDENWYAFWSPFRSELAANGFVAKLQESTGIDYRVVKIKTGLYEVAFAYSDDKDIQDKLARISAATGLDMSDS